MSHSVRSHLRLEIAEYDATIRRWIPGYETMLETAAAAAASVEPTRVVDLGSGTGALSAAVLAHEQVGHVELLDIDPEMMAAAKARLAEDASRVTFTLGSYHDPLPPADAFVACISLHHIPTMAERADLFRRLHEALPPGGLLANADCRMPADEAEQRALYAIWAEHMGRHGISEEQAYAHFQEWSEEDTYLPLEEELEALADAGFETEVVWRVDPMSAVVARKPADGVAPAGSNLPG